MDKDPVVTKYFRFGLICLVVLCIIGACLQAHGQCANGQCRPRLDVGGWFAAQQPAPKPAPNPFARPILAVQEPEAKPTPKPLTRPIPAVCRIAVRRSGERVYSTGTLIWRGSRRAVVLTVHHLFRRDQNKRLDWDGAEASFPNGQRAKGHFVIVDYRCDLAALVIDPVDVEPMPVCLYKPSESAVGGRVFQCGYGKDGVFGCREARLLGYARDTVAGPTTNIVVSGVAEEGDSGGPFINDRGELVGVLWGTTTNDCRGAYNTHICQFLAEATDKPVGTLRLPWMDETDRFAPWNARTEQEKIRAGAELAKPPATQPPPSPAGPTVDSEARAMAQNALDGLAQLRAEVTGASKAATEATAAAQEAEESAAEAAASTEALEQNLASRITTGVKSLLKALFAKWGWPTGLIGAAAIALLVWYFRRWAMAVAQVLDWITDKIPGIWDDRYLDPKIYRVAGMISGKPVPKWANDPAYDPWGRPIAGQTSPPQAPIQPAVQPQAPVQPQPPAQQQPTA